MYDKELLELYDENAQKTGRIVRRGTPLHKGEYSLSVHMFIYNDQGMFLLQKRSKTKRTLPGIWSITCGAVDAGETSVAAGVREADEELGLKVRREDFSFVGQIKRRHSFIHLYFIKMEFDLSKCVLQAEEVDEVKLCSPAELLRLLQSAEGAEDPYTLTVTKAMRERGLL